MIHSFIGVVFIFLPGTEMLTINNFLFKAQIDNINLFKVDENVTMLLKEITVRSTNSEPFDVFAISATEIL